MNNLIKRIFLFQILLLCIVYDNAQAQDIIVNKDVAYTKTAFQKQYLDIYAPSKPGLYPVHIYVHGGAWMIGDKRSGRKHGYHYAEQDIVFVSINYRLAPDDPHPAQINDVAAAVRWVVDNIHEYGGDVNRIAISGHSAGAHLVALLGTAPEYLQVQGLSLDVLKAIMPVDTARFDLRGEPKGERARLMKTATEKTFGTKIDVLTSASPAVQVLKNQEVNKGKLPIFKIFVTSERPEATTECKNFYKLIESVGGDAELFIIESASHREMNFFISNPDTIVENVILETIKGLK